MFSALVMYWAVSKLCERARDSGQIIQFEMMNMKRKSDKDSARDNEVVTKSLTYFTAKDIIVFRIAQSPSLELIRAVAPKFHPNILSSRKSHK